jgi:amino acid adenylation domain-containing protein
MTSEETLAALQQLNVLLWCEGDDLCFDALEGVLSEELRTSIQTHKAAIQRTLRSRSIVPAPASQRRLWFMQSLAPDHSFLNLALPVRLRGPVKLEMLQASIRLLIQRHDALRTGFEELSAGLFQRVLAEIAFEVPVIAAPTEAEVTRQTQALVAQPFKLVEPPLIRGRVFTLPDEDFVLLLVVHHIVCDYWSCGVLLEELCKAYSALAAGTPVNLPPLAMRGSDLASFQAAEALREALPQNLDYWKRLLEDANRVELPFDFKRPPTPSFRGGIVSVGISSAVLNRLKAVAREEKSALFSAMLAAFAMCLSAWSGQKRFVVGTDVANRSGSATERLVGLLVDQLCLVCEAHLHWSFRRTLQFTRDMVGQALANRVCFEQLVQSLANRQERSYQPVFNVTFVVQETAMLRASIPHIQLSLLEAPMETSPFDLAVTAEDWPDHGIVSFRYSRDLFEPDTMSRLIESYARLLQFVGEGPNEANWYQRLLDQGECEAVLSQWSSGLCSPADSSLFAQAFEHQARATPDAIAASCGDEFLTYAQLSSCAQSVAAALRNFAIRRDSCVAIYAKRNLDYLVSLIAVLRTGIYLPLDPQQPSARNRDSALQARCSLVLHDDEDADFISAIRKNVPTLFVKEALAYPPLAVSDFPSPEDIAYILFTSGSTGRPKGSMIAQLGMWNHLRAKVEDLEIRSTDVVAQTAHQSFDISVWQFLAALTAGARVHIIEEESAVNPRSLLVELQRSNVSIFQTVPALLRYILNEAQATQEELPNLRCLSSTGEVLPPELAARCLTMYPHVALLNAYGPTECSDDVTHFFLREPPSADIPSISIGKPIRNSRVYVLNDDLEPTPTGVRGELCVGGTPVGCGYIFNPTATAQAFAPDPFSSVPGARLYRTGDQAAWGRDGSLQYFGRLDHLIKIRGRRIELGEIDSTLRLHPAVEDAVTTVFHKPEIGPYLAAFVSCRAEVTDIELRGFCQSRVPAWMVPVSFAILPQLPITANGKIDRSSLAENLLPPPRPIHPVSSDSLTATEAKLAEVWSRVLKVPEIAVDEDLFELGGHSLVVAELAFQLRESGFNVPVRAILEHSTVRRLSRHIDSQNAPAARDARLTLSPIIATKP